MHQLTPVAGEQAAYSNLADLSPKDKPWDKHRSATDKLARLYEEGGNRRYAQRMEQCSQWLDFHFVPADNGELKFKLQDSRFCRVRHCPVCQWRRSMMWRARFFEAIPKLVNSYPKAKFLFLTLTVKNCQLTELRSTVELMSQSWHRLVKRANFPAIGYVRSLEVTRSTDGTAHPHFHCILMVPASYFTGEKYLSQVKWTELWKSCLRVDYTPVVNVKAVKQANGIEKAILETLKYSVKEEDLLSDKDWLMELTKQMHKVRAISVGGVFKDFIKEEEPEDLIHAEDEEETTENSESLQIWFGWREMVQRYVTRLDKGEETSIDVDSS